MGRQRGIKRAYHLVYVLLLNDVWRKKTQHSFVRAVYENSAVEQVLHRGFGDAGLSHIDPQHQTQATDFTDRTMLGGKAFQLSTEVTAGFVDVLEQARNLIQELDGDCRRQRAAAERGPVKARVHAAGYAVGRQDRA